MPYDEIETSISDYSPCTGITLTPLGEDGLPDHDRTRAHHFDPPITLAYAHRTRVPAIGETASSPRQDEQLPPLVGFTAPLDHPDQDALQRVSRDFRQFDTVVVVEARTPQQEEEHPDLFLLFTRWQPVMEEEWPDAGPDAPSTLLAVGKTLPARIPHPWPGLEGGVKPGNSAVLFTFVEAPADQGAA